MTTTIKPLLFFSLILLAAWNPHVLGQGIGVDMFIKACELRGANGTQISSGHIDFAKKTIEAEWLVPREYSKQELEHLLQHTFRGDADMMKISLQYDEENRKRKAERGRQFLTNIVFRRTSATESFYKVVNMELRKDNEYKVNFRGLQKQTDISSYEVVSWMFDDSLTVKNSQFAETQVFRWGRIQGKYAFFATVALLGNSDHDQHKFPEAEVAQFKRVAAINPEAFILTGETKYDGNAVAKIVEVKVKGKLLQHYWLDPSRGYICPLVRIYDDQTWNLIEEFKASDYFLDEKSGLWFPEHYVHRTCNPQDGKEWKREEYTVRRETFVLNPILSDEEFSLDIPEGLNVIDERGSGTTRLHYQAAAKGRLSLAKGGLDLDKMDWLVGGAEYPKNPDAATAAPRSYILPTIFTSVGVILVIFSLYGLWRKKHLLILLCFLPLINGCGKSHVTENAQNSIAITPAVLDFGKARDADAPVKIPFTVTNNGKEPISIKNIASDCGCTVTEIDKTPILPGKSRQGQVKVDLHGRKGDFANQLLIEFQEGTNLIADITGKIVNDIWFPGQSLRETAKIGQENVSVTFALHTIDHPEVILKLKDADDAYLLTEEYRQKEGEETFIVYTLTVDVRNEEFISTLITLEDEKSVVAPVTIPFYCYREKESAAPAISTARIGLGSLPRNAKKEVKIFGDCDTLSVIREATLRNVPAGVGIELVKNDNDQKDFLMVVVFTDENILLGHFEGSVCLKTLGNREYLVPLNGEIRND